MNFENYEQDYTLPEQPIEEEEEGAEAEEADVDIDPVDEDGDFMLEYAAYYGLYCKYTGERPDAIAKMVDPKQKAAYENLVPRLDAYARDWHGKIEAKVERKSWEAVIRLWLPIFECGTEEDRQLLRDIGKMASVFTVEADEANGGVNACVYFDYFQDITCSADGTVLCTEGSLEEISDSAEFGTDPFHEEYWGMVGDLYGIIADGGYTALKESAELQELLGLLSDADKKVVRV